MKNVLIFIGGAALGSVVTWKILEKKYRDLADEEINSVVEKFKKLSEIDQKTIEKLVDKEEKSPEEKIEETNDTQKVNYSKTTRRQPKVVPPVNLITDEDLDEEGYLKDVTEENRIIPYQIQEDDFGMIQFYGTKTLRYYTDDILADEVDAIFETRDIDLGPDALKYFDETDDDVMYIRDEDNEMDYEIIKEDISYSDVIKGNE